MVLAPGDRLGSYEVTGSLGAGGMGVVYRARDRKLNRDVAIKVLSPAVVGDADRSARFEREALVLASINHPNIAAIYGVEDCAGADRPVRALVLELVEGDTLDQRLARGPLALVETLDVARQLVEALEAAHDAGIVHRDLKPSNIKVTQSGVVKVLDFGLAKSSSQDEAQSTMATGVAGATREGVILGTAAYMSPEQARGLAVDKRTDIWAFGCVLFEMLHGTPAFAGLTMTDTLAAIIERDPDWSRLPANTPPPIRRLLKSCLDKDVRRRLREIADARFSLAVDDAVPSPEAPPAPRQVRRAALALAVVVAIASAMAAGRWLQPSRATTLVGPVRLAIPPPPEAPFSSDVERVSFALSPDGSQLGFVAVDKGTTRIWLRPLSAATAQPLPSTEGARSFMWSPNGESIAFFAGDKLKRLDLSGGVPIVICDVVADVGLYGSWGAADEIVFASVEGDAIYKVSTTGGIPTPVVARDPAAGVSRVVWPWFLPDGRRFIFVSRYRDGPSQLSIAGDGRAPRQIAPMHSQVQWVSPDYLVFAADATLVAQRFDLDQERLIGEPIPIAEPVEHSMNTFKAGFSASRNGTFVYRSTYDVDHFAWIDRSGAEVGTVGTPGLYQSFRLSRDGSRLLFDRIDPRVGTHDLWMLDLARGTEDRLTSGVTSEAFPVWTDQERSVVFMAPRAGPPNLFRQDLATGHQEALTPVGTLQQATDISPDGQTLAYMQRTPQGTYDVWTLSLSGPPSPAAFLASPFDDSHLRFSPDGRAMAWVSNATGASEIYVASRSTPASRVRVSTNGGAWPKWSHDSRELFYLSRDGRVMAVPIQTMPQLVAGRPDVLFTFRGRGWRNFEVAADGRFLAIVMQIAANEQPLNVVLNWAGTAAR